MILFNSMTSWDVPLEMHWEVLKLYCWILSMQVVSLIRKNYLFTFGLDRATGRARCKCVLTCIAESGPQLAAKAASPWTADWQRSCWGPRGSFWFKELPIKMSQWTKLNVWESSYLRRQLTCWRRNLLCRCARVVCTLCQTAQPAVMEGLTGGGRAASPLPLCGEEQLRFGSSSPTLMEEEKMPLPETGIRSEMAAVEATSFSLDLTINSVSCFTWSNDF